MKHAFLVLLLLTPSATIAQEPPDPRGPIVNPGMEPRVTAEGVFAAGYRFAPSKDAGLWQAPWIWLDPLPAQVKLSPHFSEDGDASGYPDIGPGAHQRRYRLPPLGQWAARLARPGRSG